MTVITNAFNRAYWVVIRICCLFSIIINFLNFFFNVRQCLENYLVFLTNFTVFKISKFQNRKQKYFNFYFILGFQCASSKHIKETEYFDSENITTTSTQSNTISNDEDCPHDVSSLFLYAGFACYTGKKIIIILKISFINLDHIYFYSNMQSSIIKYDYSHFCVLKF